MKKKPDFDINKKYSVFDKVSMEMLNWTGYNAELLDNLVEAGNQLLEENEKLRKQKQASILDLGDFLGIALVLAVVGWLIIGFGHLIKSTTNGYDIGYKAGQIDVLTGDRIVYEATPRGYTVKKEFEKYTSSEFFEIIEDEKKYLFMLEE